MKIGVFDSGLGGLTIVDAIKRTFKGSKIFYVADTQAAPYGEKTKEEIQEHSLEVARHLIEEFDIDALIVACNTATSAAIVDLRAAFPNLTVIGTEPGIKPAIGLSETKNIGVLATPATLSGEKYALLADQLNSKNEVRFFEQPCPGLVEQIESGEIGSEDTHAMLKTWLEPMKRNNVDTVVLGCTHYPLVKETIKRIMGEHINLVETGNAIAKRLKELSLKKDTQDEDVEVYIYFTGDINTNMVNTILDNWISGGKIMIREKGSK